MGNRASRHSEVDTELDPDLYRRMAELKRIGNRAVRRAQEENRARGIPNVYSIRGHIYYERSDGTLTREAPGFATSISEENAENHSDPETE